MYWTADESVTVAVTVAAEPAGTSITVAAPHGGTIAYSNVDTLSVSNLTYCALGPPAGLYLNYATSLAGTTCATTSGTPGIEFAASG